MELDHMTDATGAFSTIIKSHAYLYWLTLGYRDLSSYSHHLPLTFPLHYPRRSGLFFFSPYHLDLLLLIMTVLELLASLIDVWLPSHLSGEFVAFLLSLCCLLTSFTCHASIRISAPQSWAFYHPKFIHCRTDLLHEVKRKAFGLYCNRVMKDLETFNSR